MLAAASSLPLALVQSGAALRAPQLQPLSAQCKVNGMVGDCKPLGYFDPLGFSKDASPETMAKFREAELKHGRVAMLASVGYLVGAAKISFPGELAKGVTFASVAANGPYQAWDAVPQAGKLQILSIILALEWATEAKKPHYMRGGVPGKIEQLPFDGIQGLWAPKIKFWDPLNFTGALSAEQKARKRKAELKNGRLAMIGIISFITGHNLPGSVPALDSSF
mmetsp:Transcript_38113/g.123321  ORF Transcript_38113/g.123321 Transcript_38113/m.123321 type:complete len:222 (-) Transcript_38113:154-819(-)